MEQITEELISDVLLCAKRAFRADRKRMAKTDRHKRNVIYLKSIDDKYEYKLFLRQSDEFLEDFSVGLIWTNPTQFINITKSSVILIRCQGPHDGKAPVGSDIHHDYHIHQITLDDFKARRYQKPSGRTPTTAFVSFEQAIFFAINTYKIENIENIVDLPEGVNQISLF